MQQRPEDRDGVEDRYPALPLQQGMIFNGLQDPVPGIDVLQHVIRWPEPLDHAAFEAAWQRAAQRHAALRTGFRWRGDSDLTQEVRRGAWVPVERPDAAGPGADFLAADRMRGFDLNRPPLVRVTAFPGAPAAAVVTLHHAVLDGRSVAMLLAEIGADYRAIRAGRPAEFPPRGQYRDFVTWLAERGDDGDAGDGRFWTGYLRDAPTPTALPFDLGDPGPSTMDTVAVELSDVDTAALRRRAEEVGGTLNTLVHAAWALVLATYSGTADIVFGVTRCCRHGSVPDAGTMLGMFLATTPLRVAVDHARPIGDWLRRVRRSALAARDHQLTPLPSIQRRAGLPSGVPLFHSLVLFERRDLQTVLRQSDPAWRDCTVEVYRRPSFPLTLYAFAEPRLRLELIHDRTRFTPETAARLAAQVRTALIQLTGDPHRRVGELSLVDRGERRRLVRDWNGARPGYPRQSTIPDLFAAQVARTPDAPAVLDGSTGGWLSYAELDRRANRFAHLLVGYGVRADEPVGVALGPGAPLVTTLLAVLKAGAGYLPLDPADPAARTASLLADAGSRIVVVDGRTGDLPAGIRVIDLASLGAEPAADLAGAPPTAPVRRAHPLSLAYINYTSGSTGRPKGVAVSHRGVVRLVSAPTFAVLGPGTTTLHLSATAFDATTLELWGPLLNGGRVVPAPPGPLDARELAALLRTHRVNVLWLTAGLFHQLVDEDPGALAGVDRLLAGGDVLAPEAVRKALIARGGRALVNGYGPTENTTFTTCHVMVDPAQVGERIPIGRPIQHTTAYVLDEHMRIVPVGACGELYAGGDGVARGYLNNAALTSAKFVPDPFSDTPGARLYRTGDLARWRPDGALEFLGRADRQLKIRGFRVEPGEAESVLRSHPGVADAVVVPAGEAASRHLVAYVAPPADREPPAPGDLDRFAGQRLPEYLRPRRYIMLPRLPLGPTGKVDRAALPAPATTAGPTGPAGPTTPPAGPTQQRLVEIWRALLDHPNIGPHDDFFALGGDSLLAMRLAFRAGAAFDVDLHVRDVYQAPTLAGLASTVDARAATARTGTAAARKGTAIVRRDRAAYRVADRNGEQLAPHLVGPTGPAQPDRYWAAWRWIEVRGAGFGIAPLLTLGSPDCVAAAEHLLDSHDRREAARRSAIRALRAAKATADPHTAASITRWCKRVLKGRAGEVVAAYREVVAAYREAPDAIAAAAAAEAATVSAEAAYRAAFAAATVDLAGALRAVTGDPRFREAVAWQNPNALRPAVDTLHAAITADPRAPRNARYRTAEALVVSYLQRYCAKNDTIGFFGPVGWARTVDQPSVLELRPGPELLAARTVYLESWAVDALAAALTTDATRPWAVPRRMPFVDVVDGWLHVPLTPPVKLTAATAAVLDGCDGIRTARQLAADLLAERPGLVADATEVYSILADLKRQRRIAWTFEVPPGDLVPERGLRDRLEAIDDPSVREPALDALRELESGRDAAAAAAGDPDRLVSALADVRETFTRRTGVAADRRPGQFYAGRTLVHEECRRDLDVTISPELLASLWPPLSLVLESARWFTSAGAALYRRALRQVYRERVAATGSATLRLADFWLWANDTIFRLDDRFIERLTSALQQRWAAILGPGEGRDLHYEAEALRANVTAAFAAARPGWRGAVQHSPDLLIAAESAAAVRAGAFRWVLGELHTGANTLSAALCLAQHPRPQDLRDAMAADMGGPRIVLSPTREEGGAVQRLADGFVRPDDIPLVFSHDSSGVDLRRALPVGVCLLEETDGRLMVRSRDGRYRFELGELLSGPLMGQLVQHFRLLPPAAHSPRVSVDRLVVSRESWRLPAAELAFAFGLDEPDRFLRAQEWRRAHGMPRFVFAKSPVERKPFFVDLASLPSVELFGHAVRAMDREQPAGRMGVSEMLPGPDELWLTDAAGSRYTAELRMVAVDRRGQKTWEGPG